MAYPASTKTLQRWLQEVDSRAESLKQRASAQKASSSANSLTILDVRTFCDFLIETNVLFTEAEAVPGIAAYLNTEKQGTVADPVAEFVAMRNAVVATLNWLRTNVPQGSFGGTDYKLGFNFPASNTVKTTPLTFTAAQTAGYRTVLDSLIATVE